jgi:hypothetical protein
VGETVWVDINGKEDAIEEIDDRYLLNILKFISRGGGYTCFMSDEIITKLYKEADRRKLKHSLKLKDLTIAFHTKCAFESLYDWEDFN